MATALLLSVTPCYALLCALHNKFKSFSQRHSSHVGFADAWVMLLQVQTAAVEDLTAQLSTSISVNLRQEAELSAKEAQVKRLDGELSAKEAQIQRLDDELSEQQGQVHQLHTLASEKTSEVERLTAQLAEKESDIEKREGVLRKFADRLTSSQQEVAAERQKRASAAQAHFTAAQVGNRKKRKEKKSLRFSAIITGAS